MNFSQSLGFLIPVETAEALFTNRDLSRIDAPSGSSSYWQRFPQEHIENNCIPVCCFELQTNKVPSLATQRPEIS